MLTLAEQKQLNRLIAGSAPHSDAVESQVGQYSNSNPVFATRLESAINERFANDPDLTELLVACFMRGNLPNMMQALAQDCTYELAEADVEAAKAAADLGEHLRGVAKL